MLRRSPAQILFERIIKTWIVPAANKRSTSQPKQAPIPLRLALIVWETDENEPYVYFNHEVFGRVIIADVIASKPVEKGQLITPEEIKGLKRVRLDRKHWGQTYIFICQGKYEQYYVTFGKIGKLNDAKEFQRLKNPLESEGVKLKIGESSLQVAIDLIKNSYFGSTNVKRQTTLQLKRLRIEKSSKNATKKVQRYLKLPTYIVHKDDEILPLLLEARETYIDGLFFSCIGASAAAADRLCVGLLNRYGVNVKTKNELLNCTFGEKLERLQAMKLIDNNQFDILSRLNRLRNKHLHPTYPITGRTTQVDSLKTLKLLHEFLEGTLSVFRDYVIEEGRLVPRPIS